MKVPFLKEAFKNLFKSSSTRKEEDTEETPIDYRGKIEFDSEKCIGCGLCTRVCSPCAITKTIRHIDEETQEITLSFDLSSCTFCGTCSDFCTKNAITLTNDYDIVTSDKTELIVKGSFIKNIPKKIKK